MAPAIEAAAEGGAQPAVAASAAAPLPAGRERRESRRNNAAAGTRMLIIDDSPTIVALLRKFLKQNNYDVLEAFDAETGVQLAIEQQPNLIFLDIVLPGMNGFEALRRLRRDPVTKGIPVIMISGNEQATEQFYAQRIGADDFMKKPFARAEVFVRIERLLGPDLLPRRGGAAAPASVTPVANEAPVASASNQPEIG